MYWCDVFFVLGLFFSVNAYKILVVYPYPIRSLGILGEGFVRNLLDAGHEVTYVTSYPIKNANKKLRQVNISSNVHDFSDEGFSISNVMNNEIELNDVKMLQEHSVANAIETLGDQNFQDLLGDVNQSFDAVLVDYYETEIYAAISALYNCPMIWAFSMGPHWEALRLVDEASNPAYTADYLSSNIHPFTFKQRVEELWAQIKWNWYKLTNTLPREREAYQNIFKPYFDKRSKALPHYDNLIYNSSLMFSNEHHAIGNLPKIPQNLKLVGGYHIQHPPKPLPQDLQSLLDNAKHGVIYFSMGSTWNSKDLPKSVIDGLFKMFGKLKQTVIWKFEANLPNVPANVKIVKWAPQTSILAHPNLLFFITHGGLLSSLESIHFGVPIIGIPIFLDQFVNINRAEGRGYAIRVPLNFEMPNNLEKAIQTMLSNPKYKKVAKQLSSIYHHRLTQPGKEVVHWIEHVIQTEGASHLRSPALSVPFYQKLYLDLAAVLVGIACLLSCVFKRIFSKKKRQSKEKKN